MIAVIPYSNRRSPTIVYAARALEAHTPISRLIIIGAEPNGISPDDWWPSPNNTAPHANTNRHLRLAAERLLDEGVESFVWTADDTFPLQRWTPATHVRKYSIATHLGHYPRIRGYSELIRASIKLMREDGHDPNQVPCGAIHRPMLVETKRVIQTLDRLPADGHFKSLYVAGLDTVIPAGDPKIKTAADPKETADCISTEPLSWSRGAGELVRRKLAEPSRWEVPQTHRKRSK
jgi:hypothetical protein